MSICGLVITLCPDQAEQDGARRTLASTPGLGLGQAVGRRLPAVLESRDRRHFERQWQALEQLAGVEQLELTFVSYEG